PCNWEGAIYEIPLTLQVGTVIDFALDPLDSNDWNDSTLYTVHMIRGLSGDVDGSGCVDDADLLQVLFAFGATEPNDADVNCDGVVDDADLLLVLLNFGSGC
ncbi:MAG: hypothetical protein CFK49_11715, partial [Armatimonadetes bacterium JP3_11]